MAINRTEKSGGHRNSEIEFLFGGSRLGSVIPPTENPEGPNDWAKAIKQSSAKSDLSDRRLMQLDFWTQFKEYAASKKTTLRLRKAYPQHWYDISIGNSKSYLSLVVDADKQQLRCELYIPDSKPLFNILHEKKDVFEAELSPHQLEWMELPGKKASRVKTHHEIGVEDNENWEKCFQWLMETAQEFQSVFADQIKKMKV